MKSKKSKNIMILAVLMLSALTFTSIAAAETPGGDAPIISDDTSTGLANPTLANPTLANPTDDEILVIVYNYGYVNLPSTNLVTVLTNLGYSVTSLYRPTPGTISTTLASTDFDQVYLWDVTTTLGLTDSGDKTALATWYSSHRGNIAIDGRSYGLYYDVAKDKKLIENIAHAFALRDGGLWIGCDHEGWTKNGNALLTAIGYGTVSGLYTSSITGGDTTSELLTTPNTITPSTMWVGSVSKAPTGVQSDGVDLKSLMWSSTVTYTSSSLKPLAANVESADISGDTKDIFLIGESVYAKGSGYALSTTYDLYVVSDTTWTDGMPIPSRVSGTATSVTTDSTGDIAYSDLEGSGTPPALIWASCAEGTYDIVVDVKKNGQYDAGTDALDSNVGVGFEGIPEFSTIAIPVASILGLLFFFNYRKRRREQ